MTSITGYLFINRYLQQRQAEKERNSVATTVKPTVTAQKLQKSIFVPYRADFSGKLSVDQYDRVIYFGVAAGLTGVNRAENGYTQLVPFLSKTDIENRWLTLRMINGDLNTQILEDETQWKPLFDDFATLANRNGFKGVVLDLELSALPSDKVVGQITTFTTRFAQSMKEKNIPVAITMYGDVFYRHRPFDMESIGKAFDEVLIMAYDLHKAGGEPGPNFPLSGRDRFGYDFETMITDFKSVVPKDKLNVIFGMYGYDWVTDEKKRPLKPASALSYSEIQKKYLDDCDVHDCIIRRDEQAAETEINRVESVYSPDRDQYDLYPHIVWFEDEHSVERKTKFLQEQGISHISFWTYGYF